MDKTVKILLGMVGSTLVITVATYITVTVKSHKAYKQYLADSLKKIH